MQNETRPIIVAVGGTQREQSSTTAALRLCLLEAERLGASTQLFSGSALELPFYDPACAERTPGAAALIDALRRADGVILASPGYHGNVSGLFKNALDYIQDTAGVRPGSREPASDGARIAGLAHTARCADQHQ